MHKFNIYGTWNDNEIFWNNNLVDCSKDKKLIKDINTVRPIINGRINRLQSRMYSNSNEHDTKNSDKTRNTNTGSSRTTKSSKKKDNNTITILSKNNTHFYN